MTITLSSLQTYIVLLVAYNCVHIGLRNTVHESYYCTSVEPRNDLELETVPQRLFRSKNNLNVVKGLHNLVEQGQVPHISEFLKTIQTLT